MDSYMDKIKLTQPITADNVEHSFIVLRRPKVKDRLIVERMGTNDAEKEVTLIANLSGLPKEAVEEIDLSDYAQIQEQLQSFLSPLSVKN